MTSYIRRYPALVLTLASALVGLLVHLVPGLPTGVVLDVAAAAVSLIAGVEIHRRVIPVPADQRGLAAREYDFGDVEDIAAAPESDTTS
ncbi:hypothetical protein [Amycolatopsis sp. NPDC059657]|uniref:hypothetical protein n=1 Tax=Amycolatopsis sp. NPDC059657 TaxID=3346899 RepID=UPI00366CEE36